MGNCKYWDKPCRYYEATTNDGNCYGPKMMHTGDFFYIKQFDNCPFQETREALQTKGDRFVMLELENLHKDVNSIDLLKQAGFDPNSPFTGENHD